MKGTILSALLEGAPSATTAVYFVEGEGLDAPACMRRSGRPMVLAICPRDLQRPLLLVEEGITCDVYTVSSPTAEPVAVRIPWSCVRGYLCSEVGAQVHFEDRAAGTE